MLTSRVLKWARHPIADMTDSLQMVLSSARACHHPPWALEASLTFHLQSRRKMSTFIPGSPGQKCAAACSQDVGFYELAGAWKTRGVRVSCSCCLRELGGHQEPDVVATEHCQQLLGHFLEEAGKQSEGHRDTANAWGEAQRSSQPCTSSDAHRKDPTRPSPGMFARCLSWNPCSTTGSVGLLRPRFPHLRGR